MPPNILLIADGLNILRTFCQNHINCGFPASIPLNDHDVLEINSTQTPDLININLNITTSNHNGIKLCREKCETNHCSMIILSVVGTEGEKIQVLDRDADDSLNLPFSIEAFLAHIHPALRRSVDDTTNPLQESHLIRCGDLTINENSREVTLQGGAVKLTRTEFDLLKYLAERRGNVVTHSELMGEIWGPALNPPKESLRVYISQLRHKIEADPVDPHYILTVSGVGYRFRGEAS